jgi:hypothetical protein
MKPTHVEGQSSLLAIGDCAGCKRPLDALTDSAHPVWVRPVRYGAWNGTYWEREVGDLEQVPLCERCFNPEWMDFRLIGRELVAFYADGHLVLPELVELIEEREYQAATRKA